MNNPYIQNVNYYLELAGFRTLNTDEELILNYKLNQARENFVKTDDWDLMSELALQAVFITGVLHPDFSIVSVNSMLKTVEDMKEMTKVFFSFKK